MERKRKMLLVQVNPRFHKGIKKMAASKGMTMKDYVIEAIRAKLQEDNQDN